LIKSIIVKDPKSDAEMLRKRSTSGIISNEVFQRTQSIIHDIAKYGDSAIIDYTEKLDGVRLKSLKVTHEEVKQAYTKVTCKQIQSIKLMKQRLMKSETTVLRHFFKKIRISSDGIITHRLVQPIISVGCYIPGGKARYPSTLVMCTVPAKVAKVKRIVAISPPLKDGTVDPLTLVAADICGVDEFYKIGGAQGIAALAFGTSTINSVSKIVGPGGVFVTVAKILASSKVSVDMVAGPTELLIYADSSSNPRLIALDLISQAEHGHDTLCGLVTTSEELALKVVNEIKSIIENNNYGRTDIIKKSLKENGFFAVCKNQSSAIEFVNQIAPEHLEILAKNAKPISRKIITSGLTLVGKHTPSSASDYFLGSNHVLPTMGLGKSRSSLSVLDFVKIVNIVEATKSGLNKVEWAIKEVASAEGLMNHYEAVRERITK
jgi:histidinol dehydrogenase